METEASPSPIKQKRYDLSMSKRTRRTNSSKIATQANTRVESVPVLPPVTSEEKRETEQVLNFTLDNKATLQETVFAPIASEEKKQAKQVVNCTADNKLVVKETVFAPATPRPSLIELIRVTKEESNATKVAEQSLVQKKVSQEEKENLSSAVVQQRQIVKVAKSPSVVRRCAKALNQMIKVRHAPKQKSVVPLIAI